MAAIFTWSPQTGFTVSRKPNVAVVSFGDGYEQRQVKGIHSLLDKYSLTFVGVDNLCGNKPNVAKVVNNFLTARMAVESFLWTPPDTGKQKIFVCRSWSMTKTGSHYQLTAEFEEVVR